MLEKHKNTIKIYVWPESLTLHVAKQDSLNILNFNSQIKLAIRILMADPCKCLYTTD